MAPLDITDTSAFLSSIASGAAFGLAPSLDEISSFKRIGRFGKPPITDDEASDLLILRRADDIKTAAQLRCVQAARTIWSLMLHPITPACPITGATHDAATLETMAEVLRNIVTILDAQISVINHDNNAHSLNYIKSVIEDDLLPDIRQSIEIIGIMGEEVA